MKLVKHEIKKSVRPIKDSTTYAHLSDYTIERMAEHLRWHIEILACFDAFELNHLLTDHLRTKP